MQYVELRSFAGGLNTTDDSALLPYTMTDACSNVDVMDTGSITTRKGYSVVSASLTGEIKALTRYYQKDGDTYWAAVSGTALWTRLDGTDDFFGSRVYEAESLTPSGTYTTEDYYLYSGGRACMVTATTTFTTRKCSSVKFRVYGGALCGSYRVDGGAWVSIASAHDYTTPDWAYSNSALAPTTHTVSFKPATRNTSSLKCQPTTAAGYIYRTIGDVRARVSVYPTGDYCEAYLVNSAGSRLNWSCGALTKNTWNRLEVELDSKDYAREVLLGRTPLKLVVKNKSGTAAFYIDAYYENDVLISDQATTGAWVAANTTLSTDSTIYDTRRFLMVDCFSLAYPDTSGWTRSLTTLSATSDNFSFATLDDTLWLSSDYDKVIQFNGTSASTITATATPGAFLLENKSRLWQTGDAADPQLLQWTVTGTATGWTAGDSMYPFGKDFGGRSTGLAAWDNRVWYLTDTSLTAIATDADTIGQNKLVNPNIGCIAPKSLDVMQNGIIFLSAQGVMAYGQIQNVYSPDGSGVVVMSRNIKNDLMADMDAAKAAVGVVHKTRYYLAVGDAVYVCDLDKRVNQQPVWVRYDYDFGDDVAITALYVSMESEQYLYAGLSNGTIVQLDDGSSDGETTAIEWSWDIPYFAPDASGKGKEFASMKHFRTLYVGAEAPGATNVTALGTTEGSSLSVDVPVAANTTMTPVRKPFSLRGHSLTLQLSGSVSASTPTTISSVGLKYLVSPPR